MSNLIQFPIMTSAKAASLLSSLGYHETLSVDEVKAIAAPLSRADRALFVEALRVAAGCVLREADALEQDGGTHG